MVLKQCGQVTTILRSTVSTPSNNPSRVSTACWANCWNKNSLPDRRAESPLQDSPVPSTRNFTSATASTSAAAVVCLFALSSYAPAQPTQNRYSKPSKLSTSSPKTGTSKSTSSIQLVRSEAFWPHGLPLVSRFLNSVDSSDGNSDSIITW